MNRDLKEVKEQATAISHTKVFQREGMTSAKSLEEECEGRDKEGKRTFFYILVLFCLYNLTFLTQD